MRKLLLSLLFTLCASVSLHAQEAVELNIRIGKEKELHRVVIALYEQAAPRTVENFKDLVRRGFYKGVQFHRVFPDRLVQTGDPLSKGRDRSRVGTGGPGYTLPLEPGRKHTRGAVAMSRLPDKINPARHSSGSQFYICLQPMPNLDGQYTVFGEVVEGLEVLEQISQKPTDSNDFPIERVQIRSARVVPLGSAQAAR